MKLPIGKPYVKTYLYDAFPMSILAAYEENHKPWLLSNYIQLNANYDFIKESDVF